MELETFYASLERIPDVGASQESRAPLSPAMDLQIERDVRDICKLQDDLVRLAVERMSCDDFEKRWKELPQARREAIALEGLTRASKIGPDMEMHRKWCPEMTIEFLAGNGGQNYIDLLMKLVPDDIGVKITEPTMIPNEKLEKVINIMCRALLPPSVIRTYRAYFMDITLWSMLLAFVSVYDGHFEQSCTSVN